LKFEHIVNGPQYGCREVETFEIYTGNDPNNVTFAFDNTVDMT